MSTSAITVGTPLVLATLFRGTLDHSDPDLLDFLSDHTEFPDRP